MAGSERPKPFLPLLGGTSLFRRTCERVFPLVTPRNTVVVTGTGQVRWVHREAPEIPPENVIAEETGRSTAVAIALATAWIRRRTPGAVMIVLPADHWVAPLGSFLRTLRRAVGAAGRTGSLVTIGVQARGVETGLGHIVASAAARTGGARAVARFVEKPSPALARRLLRSGSLRWNSGIFVWTVEAIERELRRWHPVAARLAERWARGPGRRSRTVPASLLRRAPGLPIDRAVLERTDRLLVVPADFRWSDLGTWASLAEHLPRDRRGNGGLGRMLALDAESCTAVSREGVIAFVGVRDLIAVRSGDDVLVCHRSAAQRVRVVAERVARAARREPRAHGGGR
jgi:mannose-1-phosphate guanylyltransferase